jgi:endonuclease/exonuclease/phosphatase family metal-dependent hydrolase
MLRLATYNVLSGRVPGADPDRGVDVGALARAVSALGADVVALQEVDSLQARSGMRDQVADLLAALSGGGEEWVGQFLPTLLGTPALTRSWTPATSAVGAVLDRPAYGVALLTRLPVRSWHSLRWASAWGRMPMLVPTPRGRVVPLLVPDEPRAALAAVVETELGPMTVVGTHLSFLPPRAVSQLRSATRWAGQLPGPRVLLGDLNLPGGAPARITGWRRLGSAATFPADRPRVQLDHALADGLDAGLVATARTVQGEVSDHRALVVDLSITGR